MPSREQAGELHFSRDRCSAKLDIVPPEVELQKTRLAAEQAGLIRKDEFHITIIGRETGDAIVRAVASLPQDQQETIIDDIERRLRTFDWKYVMQDEWFTVAKRYRGDSRHDEEVRRSLIQVVAMSGLDTLYADINALLGTDFKVPFPHVTLYTMSSRPDRVFRGIGIYSEEDFHALTPVQVVI